MEKTKTYFFDNKNNPPDNHNNRNRNRNHNRNIFLCVFLAFAFSAPVFSAITFGEPDLNDRNEVLFSVKSSGGGQIEYGALMMERINTRVNQFSDVLTWFPERMDVILNNKALEVRNKYGAARYTIVNRKLEVFESKKTLPEYPSRVAPVSVSPDGMWECFVKRTSVAAGELIVREFDEESMRDISVAKGIAFSFSGVPVSWSPESDTLLYEDDGNIYFLRTKDIQRSEILPKEYRRLGAGSINSVQWVSNKEIVYIDRDIIYAIPANALYLRSLYGAFMGETLFLGRLPSEFNPIYDNFWIDSAKKKFVLLQSKKYLSCFTFGSQDESDYQSFSMNPAAIQPGLMENVSVFWKANGEPLVYLEVVKNRTRNSMLYNIENNMFKKITFDTNMTSAMLSPNKKRVAFIKGDDAVIFEIETQKISATLSGDKVISTAWAGNNQLFVGGQYFIKLWQVDSAKLNGTATNARTAASSATSAGSATAPRTAASTTATGTRTTSGTAARSAATTGTSTTAPRTTTGTGTTTPRTTTGTGTTAPRTTTGTTTTAPRTTTGTQTATPAATGSAARNQSATSRTTTTPATTAPRPATSGTTSTTRTPTASGTTTAPRTTAPATTAPRTTTGTTAPRTTATGAPATTTNVRPSTASSAANSTAARAGARTSGITYSYPNTNPGANGATSEIVLLSSVDDYFWDDVTRDIHGVVKGNPYSFDRNLRSWQIPPAHLPPVIRAHSNANESYRVFLSGAVNENFSNAVYVRNLMGAINTWSFFTESVMKRYTNGKVALVFDALDDASGLTDILLTLDSFGLKATFFINGEFLRRYPDLVKTILASGHSCASMFYVAEDLVRSNVAISEEFIRRGLARNEDEFYRMTGSELSLQWHTPFYTSNRLIRQAGANAGYTWIDRGLAPPDRVTIEDSYMYGSTYLSAAQMLDDIALNISNGVVVPVSVGVAGGRRYDYLYEKLDLLISYIYDAGFDIVTAEKL